MPSTAAGRDPEDMLLDMLQSSSPYLVGSILLAAVALAGSLIPGVAAILVAGAALAGPWEIAAVAVAGCAGYALYATGGWLLGRRYGSRLRLSGAGRRIGERRWSRAERSARGEGNGLALAAAPFLPVVGSLTPIVAGTLSVPYGRFIRWTLAGGAAWVTVYLWLGALASEALRQNRHLLVPILGCVAVVVAGLVVINYRARRSREMTGTGDAGGSSQAAGSGDVSERILR